VWIDAWRVLGGDTFAERIEHGLDRSRAVVVLVGPNGFGPWQSREIARAVEDHRRRLVPALLPGAPPGSRTPLALAGISRVDLRAGVADDIGFNALIAAIKGKPLRRPSASRQADVTARSPETSAGPPRPVQHISVRGKGNIVAIRGSIATGAMAGSVAISGGRSSVKTRKGRGT
jgi:hypothetical protein